MRRLLIVAVLGLAAVFGAGTAPAQVRLQTYAQKRVQNVPRPVIRVIPPSLALSRAMALVPNAKPIGVKLRGPLYIVKLKQGNKVRQVRIDAATGMIAP